MKVSIIIPVYKVEKLIGRCIESILNQSLHDYEVIIVNDCTPDNSIEVAKELIGNDNRFTFIDHRVNLGLMRARYTGYTVAKGDYIVFCDSDDALPRNSIELLYNSIFQTKSDIVVANYLKIPIKGVNIKSNNKLIFGNDKISFYKSLLNRELTHSLWGKIYSKSLFKNYTYVTYDNFINSEDALLLYQIINNVNKVSVIDDIVYLYYQNTESSTNVIYSDKAIENKIMTLEYIYKVSLNYPTCKKDFNLYIIKEILYLIMGGYKRKYIFKLMKSNGLISVISYVNIRQCFSAHRAIYHWILFNIIPKCIFDVYFRTKWFK